MRPDHDQRRVCATAPRGGAGHWYSVNKDGSHLMKSRAAASAFSARVLRSLLLLAATPLVMSVAVQAKEISADPTLLRLRPAVNLQRQQIATLTPKLGTCAAARQLAVELNREAESLVQTLNGASRPALKSAGKPVLEEIPFSAKLKNHEEHLRRLEIQIGSLPPCIQTKGEEVSRFKVAPRSNDMEVGASQAEKADEHKKSSEDHNKAVKDAIRKMLEQIAEINRATNL